jgi:hypothetical protein
VLGEYLGRLLERLSAPASASGSDLALVEPVTPSWIVGSIGVGYDEATDRVVLVIEEAREQEGTETEESDREAEPEVHSEAEPEPEEKGEATATKAIGRRGASPHPAPGSGLRGAGAACRAGGSRAALRPADEPGGHAAPARTAHH